MTQPDELEIQCVEIGKLVLLEMVLPNGKTFGEADSIDLANYGPTIEDMMAKLKPDTSLEDDAGLEDGSTPTADSDFITEEEDENPKGVIRMTTKGTMSSYLRPLRRRLKCSGRSPGPPPNAIYLASNDPPRCSGAGDFSKTLPTAQTRSALTDGSAILR